MWLELMRASTEHSPALADAGPVAERAADHPDRGTALLLATLLVTHSTTWQDVQVRRYARALLDAATAAPRARTPRSPGGIEDGAGQHSPGPLVPTQREPQDDMASAGAAPAG